MQATVTPKQLKLLRQAAANQASRQLINRLATEVTPQAIHNAQNGDTDAAQWLNTVAPDWRDERLFAVLAKAGRKRKQNTCAIMR